MLLHWLRFSVNVTAKDRGHIHTIPVMARPSENDSDYSGTHPAIVQRATQRLVDRYAREPAVTIEFIKEVYPYR